MNPNDAEIHYIARMSMPHPQDNKSEVVLVELAAVFVVWNLWKHQGLKPYFSNGNYFPKEYPDSLEKAYKCYLSRCRTAIQAQWAESETPV